MTFQTSQLDKQGYPKTSAKIDFTISLWEELKNFRNYQARN